jgi:Spy/CpxP family protein refolding chaperone
MFWHKWAYAHGGPCGPGHHGHHEHHEHRARHMESRGHGGPHGGWSPGFGVRRPLRFLARELDLDESQTERFAAILDVLKTQRAQAQVDHKRAVSEIAAALADDTFDASRVKAATEARAASAAEVERAVAKALADTHALLDAEQRKRLAYLLRTDALTI